MKKSIAILLVLMSVLTAGFSVMAAGEESVVDITYTMPQVFEKVLQQDNGAIYESSVEGYIGSRIIVVCDKDLVKDGVTIESMDKSVVDNWYKEEYFLNGMVYDTGKVDITGKTTQKITTKTGIPAFEYACNYTIYSDGYTDFNGFFKSVILINGNDLYCIEYTLDLNQPSTENEFQQVVDSIMVNIKINIDGEKVVPDSAPVIKEGRTLCPIRAVAEKLGYIVDWDGVTRTAIIKNDELVLEIQIGAGEMKKAAIVKGERVNEEEVSLDVPAEIINDRTYLPLRAIGEALGCEVDWDGATRTVIIKSK